MALSHSTRNIRLGSHGGTYHGQDAGLGESRPHSASLNVTFEGNETDFGGWLDTRPEWIEKGKWYLSSWDDSYSRRGGLCSSQRVCETVRFRQLKLQVVSSGRWHMVDLEVFKA